jgi:hypothetical protein
MCHGPDSRSRDTEFVPLTTSLASSRGPACSMNVRICLKSRPRRQRVRRRVAWSRRVRDVQVARVFEGYDDGGGWWPGWQVQCRVRLIATSLDQASRRGCGGEPRWISLRGRVCYIPARSLGPCRSCAGTTGDRPIVWATAIYLARSAQYTESKLPPPSGPSPARQNNRSKTFSSSAPVLKLAADSVPSPYQAQGQDHGSVKHKEL